MTEHMKEPWAIFRDGDGWWVVGDDNSIYIGDYEDADEDARRIVSCVNALAGIPTEALESGRIDMEEVDGDYFIEVHRT